MIAEILSEECKWIMFSLVSELRFALFPPGTILNQQDTAEGTEIWHGARYGWGALCCWVRQVTDSTYSIITAPDDQTSFPRIKNRHPYHLPYLKQTNEWRVLLPCSKSSRTKYDEEHINALSPASGSSSPAGHSFRTDTTCYRLFVRVSLTCSWHRENDWWPFGRCVLLPTGI